MKRPKKLTLEQKQALSKKGYNANEYSFADEDKEAWRFVHKETNETLWISKK